MKSCYLCGKVQQQFDVFSCPRDPSMRARWFAFCRISDEFRGMKHLRLCEKHFKEEDICRKETPNGRTNLKKKAEPTQNQKCLRKKGSHHVCVICSNLNLRKWKLSYLKSKVSYFGFPKDVALRKKWMKFCKLKEREVTSSTELCSLHFHSDNIIKHSPFKWNLKKEAVPMLYHIENVQYGDSRIEHSFQSVDDIKKSPRSLDDNTGFTSISVNASESPRSSLNFIENVQYGDSSIEHPFQSVDNIKKSPRSLDDNTGFTSISVDASESPRSSVDFAASPEYSVYSIELLDSSSYYTGSPDFVRSVNEELIEIVDNDEKLLHDPFENEIEVAVDNVSNGASQVERFTENDLQEELVFEPPYFGESAEISNTFTLNDVTMHTPAKSKRKNNINSSHTPSTDESPKRKCRRTLRYIGDVRSSDFESPAEAKKCFQIAFDTATKYRKRSVAFKKRIVRLEKRLNSYRQLVADLNARLLISEKREKQ